jgi:hypothetical protein
LNPYHPELDYRIAVERQQELLAQAGPLPEGWQHLLERVRQLFAR